MTVSYHGYIRGKGRLRVVPLSLSPSCVTRKKTARKKWPREILGARGSFRALLASRFSRGHFFLAAFFRVTHDGLSERGTTRSLRERYFSEIDIARSSKHRG